MNTEPSPQSQDTSEDITKIDTTPQNSPTAPVHTKRSYLKYIIPTLTAIVGLSVLVVMIKYAKPAPVQPTQQIQPASTQYTSATTGIPSRPFQNGQTSKGTSIGYVKVDDGVSKKSSFFYGRAHAATNKYEPVLFYSKNDQIFSLNTITRATLEVTPAGATASNPVFSSPLQMLAYRFGPCSIVIKDISSNTEEVVQQGSSDGTCYTPAAWSPDGTYLAYTGTSSTSSELGLVSFTNLYIYTVASKTSAVVTMPTGYNSLAGADGLLWQDDKSLLGHYVKRGQYAATLKEAFFVHNLTTKASVEYPSPTNAYLGSGQLINDTLYLVSNDQPGYNKLLSGSVTDGKYLPVDGSDGTGSFLLETNDSSSTPSNIYVMTGVIGSENSLGISRLTTKNDQKTNLYNPKGFSAYMLGWGKDYDQIIYMAILSGKAEIQQYTISQDKNEVLVADLPMSQQ